MRVCAREEECVSESGLERCYVRVCLSAGKEFVEEQTQENTQRMLGSAPIAYTTKTLSPLTFDCK